MSDGGENQTKSEPLPHMTFFPDNWRIFEFRKVATLGDQIFCNFFVKKKDKEFQGIPKKLNNVRISNPSFIQRFIWWGFLNPRPSPRTWKLGQNERTLPLDQSDSWESERILPPVLKREFIEIRTSYCSYKKFQVTLIARIRIEESRVINVWGQYSWTNKCVYFLCNIVVSVLSQLLQFTQNEIHKWVILSSHCCLFLLNSFDP